MDSRDILLEARNVSKEFNGNRVLKDISFSLGRGKILGLVGENGAGKSTLMKIIFGMNEISDTGGYQGEIYLDGERVDFKSPLDALNAGIGMVHQEFSLIPGFAAYENILLNMEITKPSVISRLFGKKLETMDRRSMRKEAMGAIDTLGVRIDPDMLVSEMPVGHKQFIEIAREIQREKVKLLVLDEPTAVLTESEAVVLLKSIKKLSSLGVSIIFISHRLGEIASIADDLLVLRDGEVVTQSPAKGVEIRQIAEWMVGRDMENPDRKPMESAGGRLGNKNMIFAVKHLWVDMPGETVKDVSFTVKKGEIFGIGGLAGQGKLGISNGIHGLYPAGGEITFNGKKLPLNSTYNMLKSGLSFVSEDRRGVGLLLDEPIYWNVTFNAMQVQDRFIKRLLWGLIRWRDDSAMKKCTEEYVEELQIKCTGTAQYAKQLSGGNQQKLCLAKAFAMEPELLIVSEPTRGIDVGAKSLVLDALSRYNEKRDTTIVMVSSELQELRSICDRIAIISEGRVAGILPPDAPSADFGLLMSNVNDTGKEGEIN